MANYETSVMIAPLAVILYYYLLAKFLNKENFESHGAIKAGFLLVGLWFLVFPMSLAVSINDANTGPAEIEGILVGMYWGVITVNIVASFYFLIGIFILLIRRIMGKKDEEE